MTERIDFNYCYNIEHLYPPFPANVDSFRILDKSENDTYNPFLVKKMIIRN